MKQSRGIVIAIASVVPIVAFAFLSGKAGSLLATLSRLVGEMASTLLALGALLLARAAWLWRRAAAVAGWPTVAGTVTEARVDSRRHQIALTTYRDAGARFYQAKISYAYEVQGRRFQGHDVQVASGTAERDRRQAEIVVARYAVGQTVQVHYNPQRPSDSLLELGLAPLWPLAIIVAGVLISAGLLGWLLEGRG